MFNFNKAKVNFKKEIGRGASGTVYPYQKTPDDERWVVKIRSANAHSLMMQMQEIVLGFSCDHPNILPVEGYYLDFNEERTSWEIYMKLPRMVGTIKSKMDELVKENKYFQEKDIIRYFYEIASGLTYLHNKKIAHRDIKPNNILIDKEGRLKISDIGIAKYMGDESTYLAPDRAGTITYCAPEVLDSDTNLRRRDLYKADAWSLGMVMAELCLMKTKLVGVFSSPEKKQSDLAKLLEEVKGKYDRALIDLIWSLLKWKSSERSSVEEVKRALEQNFSGVIREGIKDINMQQNAEESKIDESKLSIRTVPEIVMNRNNPWDNNMATIVKSELEKLCGELLSFEVNSEKLSIYSKQPTMINDNTIKVLVEGIGRQFDQKSCMEPISLSIDLGECANITDEAIVQIARYIATYHRQSSLLTLKFKNCKKVTDIGLKELMVLITTRILEVTGFYIDLERCEGITNQAFKEFSFHLGRLIHLESLVLTLARCKNLDDDGLKAIGENALSKLNKLDWLSMTFDECTNLSDSGFLCLAEKIGKSLPEIRTFALYANCIKITDITISEFGFQLATGLKNLESLLISTRSCAKITDNGIRDFIIQVSKSLKSINEIDISINECEISDLSLKEISKQIVSNLTNLKQLSLFVASCPKITNEGVIDFLNQLVQLTKLEFDLACCYQITQNTIQTIGEIVGKNLKDLQELELDLSYLKVSDQVKTAVRDSTKHIPKCVIKF